MANPEHLRILEQDPQGWNAWRSANPAVDPDVSDSGLSNKSFPREMNFRFVNFSGCNLTSAYVPRAEFFMADLRRANLTEIDAIRASFHNCKASNSNFTSGILYYSDFSSADLSHAKLVRARLNNAEFWATDLSHAHLTDANLQWADLMDANLSFARLVRTNLMLSSLMRVNLRSAVLSECAVHGASVWRAEVDEFTQQTELIITDPSEPPLRVDDLEVAQFIYLLMNYRKLRNAVDSITKKGVLLLGRFADGGLLVLQAIANELRGLGYLPFIFDFDRPADRNITETVQTLVGISRFVVVDLSGPSVPQELYATVPHFKIPFVPLLEKARKKYAIADDILEYPWVVKPILRFDSIEQLRARVATKMVAPAERLLRRRAKHS